MSDMKTETLLLHAGWRADETTGSGGRADSSNNQLSIQQYGTCLQSFCPFRARKHLHPYHEPDQ